MMKGKYMAHTEKCRGCSCENRCDFIRCTKDIENEIRVKTIAEFSEKLKPIIDEKIKGWTNSDDLRRWCARAIDNVAHQMKGE